MFGSFTRVSAKAGSVGRNFALALGLLGLATSHFSLMFLGLMLWFTATALQAKTAVERLLHGEPERVVHREPEPEPQQVWLPFPNARSYGSQIIDAEYVEVPVRR